MITAVVTGLVINVQLLIAMVVVLIAAAGAVLIVRRCIRTMSAFCFIAPAVFPMPSHELRRM